LLLPSSGQQVDNSRLIPQKVWRNSCGRSEAEAMIAVITSNPAILKLQSKITFHIEEVGLMTDVSTRSQQESVYMGMKEQ
jgi:hypothetical protein